MTDELKKEETEVVKETVKKEKQKTVDKQKLAIEKEKQKAVERQKQAIEKEREKQKEAQKVAVEKALEKEREKQKAATKKAIDKERERIRQALIAGKDPFGGTNPLSKTALKKASKIASSTEVDNEDKIVAPVEKKSLEDLLKEKAEEKVVEETIDELSDTNDPYEQAEHFNHVEMLRKKREAQKKLNEEFTKVEEDKDADIRAKLQAKALENQALIPDEEPTANTITIDEELNQRINQLEEDNARLEDTVQTLNDELKVKIEQINILSNSIVNETPVDKVEVVEEKAPEEDEYLVEIKEQGDILIRIRLLNQKIAEKDAQIKLVEDELNKLNEQDIFEKEFILQVKKVREQRQEVVKQANYELDNLATLIRSNEEKLTSKKTNYTAKDIELKEYDKELKERKMNYTEKEEAMTKRSRLSAELLTFATEIESLEENYNKLVLRYKDILKNAEEKVDNLSKIENDLIQLYLKKLRDQKSTENEEYQSQKEEREALLEELNKLNNKYEKLQDVDDSLDTLPEAKTKEAVEEIIDEELETMKKTLASVEGKLGLLYTRRAERENVEMVLRTSDVDIIAYLEALNNKETVALEIIEDGKKLVKVQEELKGVASANTDELNRLSTYINRYEIIIEENKLKIEYLNNIVSQYDNNEKVLFYKQLLRSIVELDNREVVLKEKATDLKQQIALRESKVSGE